MRALLAPLLALASLVVVAQPVPNTAPTTDRGHYVFAVYTPISSVETTVWAYGDTKLTTHRLTDGRDSSEIILRPVPHTTLRTYVATEAYLGAAAGAEGVVKAGENIVVEELLVYPTLLSPVQRQLTESYLAIRHGLTLDQNRPLNYVAPKGNNSYPVWTATEQPTFRQRIIGLARDTASGLERLSGTSVLAPGLLSLNWSRLPEQAAYLLLADDGQPTAVGQDGFLLRRWRVQTTGAVPLTRLSFDTRRFYDRALPGERWTLRLTDAAGNTTDYDATATTDARLHFPDLAFPADTSLFLGLFPTRQRPMPEATAFFAAVNLSPNPIKEGQTVQLRAALIASAGLTVSTYDVAGRLVAERRLPPSTHHLADLTFPRSGTYTLHLRPRPLPGSAAPPTPHTITLIVQ